MVLKQSHQYKGVILLVDDDLANLGLFLRMLTRHGYDVRTATSGAKAIHSLQSDIPDIILLDIGMPDMSGFEVCKRLKENEITKHIPVVFLSAFSDVDMRVQAFQVGGADYISKPFHIEEVLARLDIHITFHRLYRELQEQVVSHQQEIAERERVEQELRKYQRAVEQSPASIVITDLTGAIEYANPKFSQVTGYTLEEAKGQNPRILKSGELSSEAYRELWQKIMTGQEWRGEFHNRRKNGELFWEFASISPIFDANGTITHFLAVKEDITERKRTEEALQAAYQRLKRLNERLQSELSLAHRIQQSLLPPNKPYWRGLDVLCYTVSAREVGGDLYAYHEFDVPTETRRTRKYVIAIGDVSGKGMPAALLMSASMASFRSIVGQGLRPSEILAYLDDALVHYTHTTRQNCAMVYMEISIEGRSEERFGKPQETSVTMAHCPIQPIPPVFTLRVANAGCVSPIIRRASGEVYLIDIGGMPLGVGLGATDGYEEVTLELAEGDMIILTSDGVVEATNHDREMFGFERLEKAVRTGPDTNAETMLHYLRTSVESFVGDAELYDDLTMVVVRI